MNSDDRLDRLEKSMYGNGKRGALERLGRLEIMTAIILAMQISILVKLFIGG